MAIVISGVNNNDKITASDGTIDLLSGVNYVGVLTAPNITASNSLTAGSINVGSNIQLGNAGIATATTFVGNLTGNVNNTGNLLLQIGGSEKFRVASSGQLGIGGANYGTSGQVLTSGGSGSAATWSTISVGGGTGIDFNDDVKIRLGTVNDLEIYHAAGADSIIHHTATSGSTLRLRSRGFTFKNQANSATIATLNEGDACKLFFNGGQKFETTNTGVTVTGTVAATSFSGSGANLTGISAAAPYNAVINGEMLVSQRANDFTSVNSSGYHLDRWYFYYQNSSAAFRIRHSGDSPDGFHQSYRVNCTTADTSIASNEEVKLFHKIEGFNLASFAKGTSGAKRFTLSFYVKCNKSGTYIVELYDRDNGRDVSGSYTVSNTNWNRYTIDFPADTTGEFGFDNGSSLEISWWLVAGSAVQSGSLGTTWASSADAGSAVGQVNFTDSTSNEWMLTGVQLEPTTTGTASDFKHEDISTTLLKCKRYYQRSTDSSRGTNYSLSTGTWHSADGAQSFSKHNTYYDWKQNFEVEMRAAPTLTIYGSTNQGDIHLESIAVGSKQVDWNNNTTEVRTKGFLLRHIEDGSDGNYTSGSGNAFGILAYTLDAEL